MTTFAINQQQTRGNATDWSSPNPIMLLGSIGIETIAGVSRIKIGDGSTNWNSLPYFGTVLGEDLDGAGYNIFGIGTLSMVERASAAAFVSGRGQLFVKNDSPNLPFYADDLGVEFRVAMSPITILEGEIFTGDAQGNAVGAPTVVISFSGDTTTAVSLSGAGLQDDQILVGDPAGNAKASGKDIPSGIVVGDTDTQTLSAKTLTAPVINGTVTGTAGLLKSLTDISGSDPIINIVSLTAAEHSGGSPDAATLYLITDA